MKARFLGLAVILIFMGLFTVRQYHPGTWLMGWDSLHPEFDYKLALERVFSGAWRESQGVGAVSVHSHMAELPRIFSLWVIDLFVPMSAVRWSYVLLMLFLGVVGMYVLLVHVLSRIRRRVGMGWVVVVSLIGALAYLFNLSTLHHFLVPFEMFVVMFGLLPWSFWTVARYFEEPSKSKLGVLLLIQLFLSSAAYAATLWIGYFGVWLLLTWFLVGKKKREFFRVQALTLLTNAYWLLPTVYGLLRTGKIVEEAKINQMFSPEAWLNNVAYGTTQQVLRLESFILEWMNYDLTNGEFDLVARQWIGEKTPQYVWWGLNVVAISVIGGLLRWGYLTWVKKDGESRKWRGLMLGVGLMFIVMLSQVWPVSILIARLRESLPVLGELLRTPFTKVSIILQLGYAVLLSMGLLWLVEKSKFIIIRILLVGATLGVIVIPFYSWVTKGNLIGEVVVTDFPTEYLDLFTGMKKMANGRMVALPTPNLWGWEYRDWRSWGYQDGYEGAGFTQFGIPQPLLVRDFDRWSPYNEGFYEEFSTAIYGADKEGVRAVLEKYDVRYVLLDESVSASGQGKEILRIPETKKLAEELGWEEKFREGLLTVWEVKTQSSELVRSSELWISAPKNWTKAGVDFSITRRDVVMEEQGIYVTDLNQITYPFASLMKEEINNFEYDDLGVTVSSDLSFASLQTAERSELLVPGFKVGEVVEMQYKISYENGKITITWEPIYVVNGREGPKLKSSEHLPINTQGSELESVWVKIGMNEAKFLRKGEEITGSASLSVGEPIRAEIYDGKGRQERVDGGWSDEDASVCGEDSKYSCWSMPLMRAGRRELIQVILHYQSVTGKMPRLCLDLEGDPYHCENLVQTGLSPMVVTQETEEGEKYWMDIVVGGKKGDIELLEPGIVRYPLVSAETIASGEWGSFLNNQEYEIEGGKVEVTVNGGPKRYDFGSLGKKEMTNCDLLSRGKVSKSLGSELAFTLLQKTENSEVLLTKYTAQERGAICDFVEMSELQTQLSYLMRIRGENREGRSVKLFFYNTGSKRNDLEYLLNKENFDQTFAVLPWEFPGSYSLNIETRSFGQPTENAIYPVEVRYFPLEQIARAKMVAESQGSELPESSEPLTIIDVKKIGTWLYKVKYSGEGLVKLSQGYDEGWIGIAKVPNSLMFGTMEHIMVNGWSNGWIVDGKRRTGSSEHLPITLQGSELGVQKSESETIWIFYWPQLLEYLGFGMMGVVGWQLGKRREKQIGLV